MIPEWFEMSLKHFSATIFDGGKLKPENIFQKKYSFGGALDHLAIKDNYLSASDNLTQPFSTGR